MSEKDFFDEELDKIENQHKQNNSNQTNTQNATENGNNQGGSQDNFSTWVNSNPTPAPPVKHKPLYVVLLCLSLVLAMVLGGCFGSFLSTLHSQTDEQKAESGQLEKEEILSTVLDYMYQVYYKDVSDTTVVSEQDWIDAIGVAGTAIMQYAGDQFSRLLTPQQYYNLINPTSSYVNTSNIFGISYSLLSGVGLQVSSVLDDTSCFGVIQEGDIVLKISDAKAENGSPINYNGEDLSTVVFSNYNLSQIQSILMLVNSATFHVLRNGEVLIFNNITRGPQQYPNQDYKFEYVEFYFGDTLTNVSTTPIGNATHTTKEVRSLANLPSGVGYIRIKEFGKLSTSSTEESTTSIEFLKALNLFKQSGCTRLILDLKGNPGGYVDEVSNVAGYLITDALLTDEQKSQVTVKENGKQQLLITSLVPRVWQTTTESRVGTYTDYFTLPTDGKTNIVIWTDGNSASASELLTGALTDYGVATQMGTKTYGKGIAQTYNELDFTGSYVDNYGVTRTGNWAIYYTYASYYSPLGTNIHGKGYTPADPYNNLDTYDKLWTSTLSYWGL